LKEESDAVFYVQASPQKLNLSPPKKGGLKMNQSWLLAMAAQFELESKMRNESTNNEK
jgi:hypothetical protein